MQQRLRSPGRADGNADLIVHDDSSLRQALPPPETVFVFRAMKADRLKLLYWDGTDLVMAYKRLEEHTFIWPAVKDGLMLMNHTQFEALFAGLDWRRVRAIEAPPTHGCLPHSPPSFVATSRARLTTCSRGITPSQRDRDTAYGRLVDPVVTRSIGIVARRDARLSPSALRFRDMLVNEWHGSHDP